MNIILSDGNVHWSGRYRPIPTSTYFLLL